MLVNSQCCLPELSMPIFVTNKVKPEPGSMLCTLATHCVLDRSPNFRLNYASELAERTGMWLKPAPCHCVSQTRHLNTSIP